MKEEISKINLKKLKDALTKKAVGYMVDEIVEEYVLDENGVEKLFKKKVTKKFMPPDLAASKVLMDYYSEKSNDMLYENMSDEELDKEAVKLFKEYQSMSQIDMFKELKGEDVGDNTN